MKVTMKPIGFVHTDAKTVPRHWTVSDVEGTLMIDEIYQEGLRGIEPGQRIVVIFHFHKSPEFVPELLQQSPPHKEGPHGVFAICSPRRPNPVGMSVLEVLEISGSAIRVRGIDMLDQTPILDIKPYVDKPYGQ